jgi:HTH-type transcriptional regulator/antitoxin HipB
MQTSPAPPEAAIGHPEVQRALDGGLDVPGLVRRVRRNAGLSQRGLAAVLGCGKSTVAKWETGRSTPRIRRLEQLLAISSMALVVNDHRGEPARAFGRDAALDRGGRQYPAHVDIRRWRHGVYWWGDQDYGVHCLPPEFVWDSPPRWPPIWVTGVDLDRPDDERVPRQGYRQRRTSFGSFRAAWRKAPGFNPPKGFGRSDAIRGGYHPEVVGLSTFFLETLDADGRAPDDDRFT